VECVSDVTKVDVENKLIKQLRTLHPEWLKLNKKALVDVALRKLLTEKENNAS
jgi:hypothetical protein